MGAPTQGGCGSCRSATALRTTWLRAGGRGGLQGEKLMSLNISEVACARELMRGWEGEEENPKWQPAVSSSRGVGAGRLLHLGAPPTSGGAYRQRPRLWSLLSFCSRASPQILGRAPLLPKQGPCKYRGSSPHPSPTSADSFKARGWPGRGQKERIWGVSTTLPLVDASKTDLCHEAHPSLKSAGPTLGELGVGTGMRRPERRTLQKSCPEAQPRVRALRKGPPTSCVTLTQSSSHTSWAPFSLIKVIGSTPQRLCLPLPSTPSGRAAISRLHSCPLPPAHLHSAARVSLIKGDSGPAISLLVPHPDPLPCELKTFAFSSFTGLSGIFHCRRK